MVRVFYPFEANLADSIGHKQVTGVVGVVPCKVNASNFGFSPIFSDDSVLGGP